MTSPDPSQLAADRLPRGLAVASPLCWLLGLVALGLGVAIGIPAATVPGRGLVLAIGMAAAGLALCYAGFGLRKAQPRGLAGICAAGGFVVLQLIGTGGRMALSTYLCLAIILLVAANWKHLRTAQQGVGA